MKVGGNTVVRCEEVLVLPRSNGPDLVFKAWASCITDEAFEELCPRPKANVAVAAGGKRIEDTSSRDYLKQLDIWATKKHAYMMIQSLEPSVIEWDIVKLDDSKTWPLYTEDFQKAGLCDNEIIHIQNLVLSANALNQRKLEIAKEAFLLGQGITQ